jgi:hypothetical protein
LLAQLQGHGALAVVDAKPVLRGRQAMKTRRQSLAAALQYDSGHKPREGR